MSILLDGKKALYNFSQYVRQYPHVALAFHHRNKKYAKADKRFLVVTCPGRQPFFYDLLLHWLEAHFPDIRARFELRALPCSINDWALYVLHVPWLQDPVQRWSPLAYRWAFKLSAECAEHNVPVINEVAELTNATKSTGAKLIASAGARTPKMVPIEDIELFRKTLLGLSLPLLVREDWGHGLQMYLASTMEELLAIPIEKFERPLAVEFIDVQSAHDGLYRKYRYTMAGDIGVSQSIHACKDWCARGNQARYSDELRDEEMAFISAPNPHHDLFLAARKALKLDFVAFDYSYDQNGQLVVWEANPYPYLHFPGGRREYRSTATARVLAAMTILYLERAGLEVPESLRNAAVIKAF